jgi:16S rRNA (cytosine967-C5)-methyltransferase
MNAPKSELAPPKTARDVASRVLFRVAEKGAWAAPALDAELARARLEVRDRALATEIVYGALRTLAAIDGAIDRHLKKKGAIDPFARAAMRAAAYQVLYLDRVPAHAAVDAAVTQVRRERSPKLAGFVNAILRKVAAAPRLPKPDRLVVPAWFEADLERSLGEEGAARFLAERPLPPPISLRARIDRDVLRARIEESVPGVRVEHGVAPSSLLVYGAGDPRKLPGYAAGDYAVQEEGAQLVALELGARAGERVADLCAGHGGKTMILAEAVGASGRVVAVDLHESKLEDLERERARLAISTAIETEAIDLVVGLGGLTPASFDRVLVDAPCTGAGTIHRRPELLLRLAREDAARLADVQTVILDRAIDLVKSGGEVVYAVCSPFAAEGPGVVDRVLGRRSDVVQAEISSRAGDLRPLGYQIAHFIKKDLTG